LRTRYGDIRGPFEDGYLGLAAAIGLRMISHWWLTRLRD
jgi:hypothetical protein